MTDWRLATALKYVSSSSGDSLLSFISVISIFGLVLGVAVLVIVLSVMNGFERELRERVLGVMPQGVIYSKSGFDDYESISSTLLKHSEITGVAPFLEGGGLFVANDEIQSARFFAVEPEAEKAVSILHKFVIEGDLASLSEKRFNIAMGKTLVDTLGLALGDKVTMVLPEAQFTLAGVIPRSKRFTLSIIFEVGADVDKDQVLIHLQDGMKLTRSTRLHAVRIASQDLFEVPRVLRESMMVLSETDLSASSWMRRHGSLYDAIQMQKSTMFLLLLLLVAVAAFNVISNLVMLVNQKKPDIAILRTMGASTNSILMIFITYGSLIGALGVAFGLVLGVVIAANITQVYAFVDNALNLGLMGEYFIHYLPSEVLLDDVLKIGVMSLLICFCVTIYPALVAAKSNPVEVLQYE